MRALFSAARPVTRWRPALGKMGNTNRHESPRIATNRHESPRIATNRHEWKNKTKFELFVRIRVNSCRFVLLPPLQASLNQLSKQRPMTSALAHALRRAKQRDRLPRRHAFGQRLDRCRLRLHLRQIPPAIVVPGKFEPRLPIRRRVQLFAGPQVRIPRIPGLIRLRQPARPIPANEQPKPIGSLARIVPPFSSNRHGEW